MKKYTLLIIIGSLFLLVGVVLFINNKKGTISYYNESSMSEEEVSSLIIEKIKSVIDIFESPKEKFMLDKEIDENSDYLMILNYDAIVYNLYTEKGIEELEKIKFDNKSFVKKDGEDVYVLKSIPDNNRYRDFSITINNINYNKDTITAVVAFTKNSLDSNNVVTYYVYEKNIELVKMDNKWLINTFIYSNV